VSAETGTTALDVADRPGVFVKTRRGEVHVVVDGDPALPAVACIHGIPGGTRDFRAFAGAATARGLSVVRIDLPGFGRTPAFAGPLLRAAVDRADLVHEVMLARGHSHFAVVGHSFGGTTALAAAARHASSVTALVMVNSAGVTRHRGLQIPHELTRQVKHLAGVPLLGERLLGTLIQTYARMGIRGEKPLDHDDVIAHTELIGGLDFKDLRLFAAAVTAPALVVSALDDRLVEPQVAVTLAAALAAGAQPGLVSHRQLVTGGHFLQKRDAPAIASWIAGRVSSR